MTTSVWLLIALPLAGAAILLLGGKATDAWGHLLGCATMVGAFLVGATQFVAMSGRDNDSRLVHETLFSWVPVAQLQVDFGLRLDQLSMCFVLLITGVGALIHIYSVGYMAHGPPVAGFRLPQPVRRCHAAAGAGRQLSRPVRRMGRRRPGVVPADRVLVAQAIGGDGREEGVRRQPRR